MPKYAKTIVCNIEAKQYCGIAKIICDPANIEELCAFEEWLKEYFPEEPFRYVGSNLVFRKDTRDEYTIEPGEWILKIGKDERPTFLTDKEYKTFMEGWVEIG